MCGGTLNSTSQPIPNTGLSPRVRGNLGDAETDSHSKRSIPRVRGNLTKSPDPGSPQGSIPACAGEPITVRWDPPTTGVYPRVCGGTSKGLTQAWRQGGLSPRVRGNRDCNTCHFMQQRSIPACAGEPSMTASDCASPTVYPRVCGGTSLDQQRATRPPGLSPRVRGNRNRLMKRWTASGSIPACAGEPMGGILLQTMVAVYPACAGEPTRT